MIVRSRTMTVRSRTMTVRSRTAGLPATCEVAHLTKRTHHRPTSQPDSFLLTLSLSHSTPPPPSPSPLTSSFPPHPAPTLLPSTFSTFRAKTIRRRCRQNRSYKNKTETEGEKNAVFALGQVCNDKDGCTQKERQTDELSRLPAGRLAQRFTSAFTFCLVDVLFQRSWLTVFSPVVGMRGCGHPKASRPGL